MKNKEYEEFMKMTEPLKFRSLKLAIRVIVDHIKVFLEKFKNFFYDLLSRLNLVDREDFKDTSSSELVSHSQNVEAGIISAEIVSKTIRTTDVDYTVYCSKSGRLLHIDHYNVKSRIEMFSHLDHIGVKIDEKMYYSNLPTIKVLIKSPDTMFGEVMRVDIPEVETMTLSTDKVADLRHKMILDMSEDIVLTELPPEEMMEYYYDTIKTAFSLELKNLTLVDLKA